MSFAFYNFSVYDCHLFLKSLVDEMKDKVKFDIIPKTIGENNSVTYVCAKMICSYRLLSIVLFENFKVKQ